MARFFIDNLSDSNYILSGDDAHHAIKSLRMQVSDELILCSKDLTEYRCKIQKIEDSKVFLNVLSKSKCTTEPNTEVSVFQAIPKSDKMDLIVQKSVELGASSITPVLTSRCISRPDNKSMKKKVDRLNKISAEAAKQSRRGKIPTVLNMINFKDLSNLINQFDIFIVFYERGGSKLRSLINKNFNKIGILVGPEGGFSTEEINFLESHAAAIATLGPRILRTETAPLMALSIIMELTENV